MNHRPRLTALAFVVVLLTACGGDTPSISGDAAGKLRAEVSAVRSAVQRRDTDGAARALETLRASVERLRRAGDITDERAAEILAAAGSVETQLVSITTTTTTTTTTLPPAPAPEQGEDDEQKGKGNKGRH